MTDPTHSADDSHLSDEDEIVSAVLDGEASPAEVERVQADPRLSARLAEFRALHGQIAEPVPELDEVTRRRLVATAMAAAEPPGVAHPVPLAPTPWWRRNAWGIGSAAAVVALALLAGPALLSGLDSGADDMATAGVADEAEQSAETLTAVGDSIDADGDAAPAEADDGEAGEGAANDSSDAAGGDVPDTAERIENAHIYPTVDDLRDAVGSTAREPAAEAAPTTTWATGYYMQTPLNELRTECGTDFVDGLTDDQQVVNQLRALVDGRYLIALGTTDSSADISGRAESNNLQVLVVDPTTCAVVPQ